MVVFTAIKIIHSRSLQRSYPQNKQKIVKFAT